MFAFLIFQGKNSKEFDLNSYTRQNVDRFGVLLDLWTNEVAYLDNKRQVNSLRSIPMAWKHGNIADNFMSMLQHNVEVPNLGPLILTLCVKNDVIPDKKR